MSERRGSPLKIGRATAALAAVAVVAVVGFAVWAVHVVSGQAPAPPGRTVTASAASTSTADPPRHPSAPTRADTVRRAAESPPATRPAGLDVFSLTPPLRPAWEWVEAHRRRGSVERSEEDLLFAALSFCVNTRESASLARQTRARGETHGVASLESSADDHARLCGRLSEADFNLRSEIARRRTQTGDDHAALMFFEVGPGGRWGDEASRVPAAAFAAWKSEAIGHLERAARQGHADAFVTLSMLHAAPVDTQQPELNLFPELHDPAKGYGYWLAWSRATTRKQPGVQEALDRRSRQMASALTADEVRRGEVWAEGLKR